MTEEQKETKGIFTHPSRRKLRDYGEELLSWLMSLGFYFGVGYLLDGVWGINPVVAFILTLFLWFGTFTMLTLFFTLMRALRTSNAIDRMIEEGTLRRVSPSEQKMREYWANKSDEEKRRILDPHGLGQPSNN